MEDGKDSISELQELVQSSLTVRFPAGVPVLSWGFDTCGVENEKRFRATVAFALDGIPHHVCGDWATSKAHAKRDTSQRALGLFVGRWMAAVGDGEEDSGTMGSVSGPSPKPDDEHVHHFQVLLDYCDRNPSQLGTPNFSTAVEADGHRTTIELSILETPHAFPGACCATGNEAMADAACRLLWYLQCDGYEDILERADEDALGAVASAIPCAWPPADTSKADSATTGAGGASRELPHQHLRHLVAQAKDCLRKAFSTSRGVPEAMVHTHWKMHTKKHGDVMLWRATARASTARHNFSSPWRPTHDEAKAELCRKIISTLDLPEPLQGHHSDGRGHEIGHPGPAPATDAAPPTLAPATNAAAPVPKAYLPPAMAETPSSWACAAPPASMAYVHAASSGALLLPPPEWMAMSQVYMLGCEYSAWNAFGSMVAHDGAPLAKQ